MLQPGGNRRKSSRVVLAVSLLGAIALLLIVDPVSRWRLGRAESLLRSGHPEAALEVLAKVSARRGQQGRLAFLRARAHRKLGGISRAEAELQQAEDSGYSPNLVHVEHLLIQAQTGKVRVVEEALRAELARSDENTQDICEALVNGYLLNYRFEDAAKWLDAWEADFPDDPRPHLARGRLSQHMSLWNEAAEAFGKAIALSPQSFEAYGQLARCYRQLNQYEDAVRAYQQAQRLNPTDVETLAGLAHSQLPLGQIEDARRLFTQLLDMDGGAFYAALGLGELALGEGEFETALDWLEKAHAMEPRSVVVRNHLASVLRATGRSEEAQQHLDFIEDANQAMSEVQEFSRQVHASPEVIEARYEIGVRLLEFASEKEGLAWLYSVLELAPQHAATHQTLARHFARQGDEERARHHQQLAAPVSGGP